MKKFINRRKKEIFIIAGVLGIVIVGVVALVVVIDFSSDGYVLERVPIYFFNAGQGELEAEYQNLPQVGLYGQIDTVLGYFFSRPSGSGLLHVLPAGVDSRGLLTEIYVDDDMLVASFSEIYQNMSAVDEAIFRSAFTLTMVGLPQVERVKFRTVGYNGEAGREWVESAATVANNPFISSTRRATQNFILYFVDESGEGLIYRRYTVADVDTHRRLHHLIELLIAEQNAAGIMPLIPTETRVLDVQQHSPGIYIDFSSEFQRFSGNSTQANLMLQSITHTINANHHGTRLDVFFLVDSRRWEDFHGVSGFNLGFSVDETVMLGFTPPEEYEPYEVE
ncbi:MAG: GerMN domain-containing protein [Defluviitaleaceae bacterium]|nr:GerMN domain-containing protein [Defluviitaleaceae bacterium]